jgi:hypothetical protein
MLEQSRLRNFMRNRGAAKFALICGDKTAKPARRQSHRISLLAGLKHISSQEMRLNRMND